MKLKNDQIIYMKIYNLYSWKKVLCLCFFSLHMV